MAPELLDDEPTYSTASDIYAYGMVMWEIVTGKIPFEGIRDLGVIYARIVSSKPPKIPEETPSRYKKLIEDCWSKRSDQRPTVEVVLNRLK